MIIRRRLHQEEVQIQQRLVVGVFSVTSRTVRSKNRPHQNDRLPCRRHSLLYSRYPTLEVVLALTSVTADDGGRPAAVCTLRSLLGRHSPVDHGLPLAPGRRI